MEDKILFDETTIFVRSGKGGDGCVAFRREKFVPFGGPSGGNGGEGGSVYVMADRRLNTLILFRRRQHFRAEPGAAGLPKDQQGKKGSELVIPVPLGTNVRDVTTGDLLADLVDDGQKVLVARGGRGGRGNAVFATSTNQAPRWAEKGEPYEERTLRLEMKLIADVGIVGVPNAGKSTLLSAVSAARPKIADYPFTTLVPNLGVAMVDDHALVLADIPGLIEGAHGGAGLGTRFLRHIERTRLLIHLLDGASSDPLHDYDIVNAELDLFSPRLAAKPQIIVLNKMDLPSAQESWPKVQAQAAQKGLLALAISAVTGQGTVELLRALWAQLQALPAEPLYDLEPAVIRPVEDENAFEIIRDAGRFRIRGIRVERMGAMTDWENDEGVARFQRQLKAMGIMDALRDAGIKGGDTVVVGTHELEWQ
jgi:GTPase